WGGAPQAGVARGVAGSAHRDDVVYTDRAALGAIAHDAHLLPGELARLQAVGDRTARRLERPQIDCARHLEREVVLAGVAARDAAGQAERVTAQVDDRAGGRFLGRIARGRSLRALRRRVARAFARVRAGRCRHEKGEREKKSEASRSRMHETTASTFVVAAPCAAIVRAARATCVPVREIAWTQRM